MKDKKSHEAKKEEPRFKPGMRVELLEVTAWESGLDTLDKLLNGTYLPQGMIKYAGRPFCIEVYEVILDEKGQPEITNVDNLRIEGRVTVYGHQIRSLEETTHVVTCQRCITDSTRHNQYQS